MKPGGPVRYPIPTRFLAPVDCLKIPALFSQDAFYRIQTRLDKQQFSPFRTGLYTLTNLFFTACTLWRPSWGE
jgi:hypothetical protein